MTVLHRNARQGEATHKEVHRDTGPARGPMSPLKAGHYSATPPGDGPYGKMGFKGTEGIVHRDEDFASAPMERLPKGRIPDVNQRAGVTTAHGAHGPRGTPRDERNG